MAESENNQEPGQPLSPEFIDWAKKRMAEMNAEAAEATKELGLPEDRMYDVLAVMHGEGARPTSGSSEPLSPEWAKQWMQDVNAKAEEATEQLGLPKEAKFDVLRVMYGGPRGGSEPTTGSSGPQTPMQPGPKV